MGARDIKNIMSVAKAAEYFKGTGAGFSESGIRRMIKNGSLKIGVHVGFSPGGNYLIDVARVTSDFFPGDT